MNNKTFFLNVFGNTLLKVITFGVSLILIPLILKIYGKEIAGIWFTVVATITTILNTDFFGLNNTLRNRLAIEHSNKENQKREIHRYFNAGIVVSILLFIIGSVLIGFIDYYTLSLWLVYSILFLCCYFFIPKIVVSFLNYEEKTFMATATLVLPNVLFLILFYFISSGGDKNIPLGIGLLLYSLSYCIPVTIFFFLFLKKDNQFNVNISIPNVSSFTTIIREGFPFFSYQIMFLLLTSFNEIFFALSYGSEVVTEYQIYFRLYSLFIIATTIISNPLWSRISILKAENKLAPIIKFNSYIIILSTLFLFFIILFNHYFSNLFFKYWLKDIVFNFDYKTGISFSIYAYSLILLALTTSVSNGLNKIKIQSYCFSGGFLIKLIIFTLIYLDIIKVEWCFILQIISGLVILISLILIYYNNKILNYV